MGPFIQMVGELPGLFFMTTMAGFVVDRQNGMTTA
jgi:hypothetical protein